MMQQAIELIENEITEACINCGRQRNEVKLIAVSKIKPVLVIEEAYKNNLHVFGESRPQEFRDKVTQLPDDIEWHFIGHLQKNKIKYVAGKAKLIHSVDSYDLAEAISQYSLKQNIDVAVLLEVNTAEDTKFGVTPDSTKEVFMKMMQLPGIQLKGFMTIAPFVSEEQEIRESFQRLRSLKEELTGKVPDENIAELSMGMSQDFQIAIEEGSTMVRIGTAIFGAREV